MPASPASPPDSISLTTATSICIASMVGTGVFTSLGFQVTHITSGFALLMLWVLGGLFALCGALSYSELAAALPRSGGELHFLGRVFHPLAGFLAGWVSITFGFPVPIALAAMAFGRYFSRIVPGASPIAAALILVGLVTFAHLRDLRLSSTFQNTATAFKVGVILVFLGAAVFSGSASEIHFAPTSEGWASLWTAPFAISLLFVMYAYAGWNSSTYVVSEVRNPAIQVPRSLFLGTLIVTVLYVALHWAFLATTPIDAIAGKVEVGHVVAAQIFGDAGGRLMSAMLCIALVSSISAYTWAGPRVTQVMGEDFRFFRALARTNRRHIPQRAILVQAAIVVALLIASSGDLEASFEAILVSTQFILVTSSACTVLGVFWLRHREPALPRPYKTWGYPITPLLFVLISLVTMVYTVTTKPLESLATPVILALGGLIYHLSRRPPA